MTWNETTNAATVAVPTTVETPFAPIADAEPTALVWQIALSLGIGFLIGLQRERTNSSFGGVRTFPLIGVLGTLCAVASTKFGFWILPSGLLCVTLIGISERAFFLFERARRAAVGKGGFGESGSGASSESAVRRPKRDFGTTTLVCALATFCVGAILANPNWTVVGLEAGAIVAILLQIKPRLHKIAETLGENDMNAIMQFVLASFVAFPLLPNRPFGPFGVFNPYEIWLNVVLIVGVSLAGYVVYKFCGQNAGVFVSGLLGGAVSSAATTTSCAKSVALGATTRDVAAVVILLASAMQTVRAAILQAAVSPEFFYRCLPASAAFFAASVLPAIWIWRSAKSAPAPRTEKQNPTQWKTALTFGALYVVVLFAIKASQACFGDAGTFASVALSGLVEMNAVALSVSRMATTDPETMANGWKLMMIASIFSYFFKIGVVFFFGGARFGLRTLPLFAIPCGVAAASVALF